MLTSNSAHVGSAACDAADAIDVSKEMLVEWLKHPVTKVIAIVVVAELAHRMIVRYGVRLLLGGGEGASIDADA